MVCEKWNFHFRRQNLRRQCRAASAKVVRAEADLAVERMKLYGKIVPGLTGGRRQPIAGFEHLVDNVIARIGSWLDN
jgi:hypothetical protein